MSVYTMDIEKADCTKLLAALGELSVNWSKQAGLAHKFDEGVLYHKIRDAIKSECGDSYVIINDGTYSDNYSVVKTA